MNESSLCIRPRLLVVYDFDWSMVDEDTDHWVFKCLDNELSKRQIALETSPYQQWTDLQHELLGELYNRGFTERDIEAALKTIPMDPAMLRLLHNMNDEGCEMLILSDSNQVYIDTVLNEYGIRSYFTKIITNPAGYNENGRLCVRRYIGLNDKPHNCKSLCKVNLCKGIELEKYINNKAPFDRIMYVGDGMNDFCPATRLRSQDFLFCRTDRALYTLLGTSPGAKLKIKAKIIYWSRAEELRHFVVNEFLPLDN
ncbi:uncharacterized protein VTP21DRAFT_2373 [Calcarisporiella thermophila]|uniref:uncharacterized protein n=1 Tax=Calcarisporiella thermophila TaxID=911321 RepID=UPI0037439720